MIFMFAKVETDQEQVQVQTFAQLLPLFGLPPGHSLFITSVGCFRSVLLLVPNLCGMAVINTADIVLVVWSIYEHPLVRLQPQ